MIQKSLRRKQQDYTRIYYTVSQRKRMRQYKRNIVILEEEGKEGRKKGEEYYSYQIWNRRRRRQGQERDKDRDRDRIRIREDKDRDRIGEIAQDRIGEERIREGQGQDRRGIGQGQGQDRDKIGQDRERIGQDRERIGQDRKRRQDNY